jgi:hypothetical protein
LDWSSARPGNRSEATHGQAHLGVNFVSGAGGEGERPFDLPKAVGSTLQQCQLRSLDVEHAAGLHVGHNRS